MVLIPVCCPHCGGEQVTKGGTTAAGKQRYRCQNEACSHQTFIRDYSYRAYLPEVKQQMIDLAVNGSGIRDTGRVLRVGKDTVVRALKKRSWPRIRQYETPEASESRRRDRRNSAN